MRTIILAGLAATILFSAPAEARQARHAPAGPTSAPFLDVAAVPAYPLADQRRAPRAAQATPSHRGKASAERRQASIPEKTYPEPRHGETTSSVSGERIVGGRSGSCLNFPKTRGLWCGCSAADELGLDNSTGHWNLAANYFEFPTAAPAPNMVAVRNGHVAVLKHHISGSVWMAFDGNSGGNLARIHPIDLRRFTRVVDPHGGVAAADGSVQFAAHRRHRHIRLARR